MKGHARHIGLFVALALLAAKAVADDAAPLWFIQLTDPQFGMYARNADFAHETANFEFAIATVNRLKPTFVIITGDLVNKADNQAQVDEYLRICKKLDPAIRCYHVAGNHDVGNDPTPESIAAYEARFGTDHYTFRHGDLLGIVLNSNLIKSAKTADLAAKQRQWLEKALASAVAARPRHIVVFQHHPWFFHKPDEPDVYFNLPKAARQDYLSLLEKAGVTHIFAGHYHSNQLGLAGRLEMVTTGPIGKPMRGDSSGMRIVQVRPDRIEHAYFDLGRLPHRLEPNTTATLSAKATAHADN